MKKFTILCTLMILAGQAISQTPTGHTENFDDNTLTGWSGNSSYVLTESNQELNIDANVANGSWAAFTYNFSALNLSLYPFVKIKIKSNPTVNVRIDLVDQAGKTTNASPVVKRVVSSSSYSEFIFNYNGKFSQSWPNASTVNPSAITGLVIFFAPGSSYTGSVQFDDLRIGTDTGLELPQDSIRLNQIGFYPNGQKLAIAVGASAGPFYLVSQDKQDTVFTGTLGNAATWSPSGESVRKANFTSFTTPGTYYVLVPGIGYSHEFEIKNEVHHDVAKALLKAFYFQRASTALTSTYAGPWARALGHPDNAVIVHNSAASPLRPAGTTINASLGWYDAGDYNKYVVNSGISTYTFLRLYEEFPDYFDTVNLHIPESSNNVPDILDEGLWNVRWLLKMQDPYDGGVYHKVTNSTFGGSVMPANHTSSRYVVKKSTGAALNFAAVMAQSARIFSKFETELPGLADSCINAAVKAWIWARKNPNVIYQQSALTDPPIFTGEYYDNNFSDEFQWAGFELYTTTKLDSFYTIAGTATSIPLPGWNSVRALGYYTISHYRKHLTPICDTTTAKNRVISLGNPYRYEANLNSAYGVSMTSGDFYWGSSSVAANQGLVALLIFNMTKDSAFFITAVAQLDYLLGRNGTNYCFVTGHGDVKPMDIHHRICAADGVEDPIPGLLVGGPNTDATGDCGAESYPSTLYKARAYLDAYCSYSTNEIAINWNAPAAFLAGALEALHDGAVPKAENYVPVLPTEILSVKDQIAPMGRIKIYPNPASSEIIAEVKNLNNGTIKIFDNTGRIIKILKAKGELNYISIEELPQGIYTILISDDTAVSVEKFVKE
jgi:endoglucanase